MQINPGGRLAPEDIVGRDREIHRYWQILERQSLVLSAERRVGKTHIVWKMHNGGRKGFVTFYQDLEGVHRLVELVRSIYDAVGQNLSMTKRAKAKLIEWHGLLPRRFGDLELPNARDNWQALLATAVTDALDAMPEQKLVLMWDELPLMLHNMQRTEGAADTLQLLDLLRRFRQQNDRLRFLFTGSIGLHLVLNSLRRAGNANDPTNDMQVETVPPMVRGEALDLAVRLLSSIALAQSDSGATAAAIVDAVDGFPYYIHHVADHLSLLGRSVGPADVLACVDGIVAADNDPAHLRYYVERIQTYYPPDDAALALLILGAIANSDAGLDLDELTNLVRHQKPEVVDERVRQVCDLLRQDHYLTLSQRGRVPEYDFRWRLVKRWWRKNRP